MFTQITSDDMIPVEHPDGDALVSKDMSERIMDAVVRRAKECGYPDDMVPAFALVQACVFAAACRKLTLARAAQVGNMRNPNCHPNDLLLDREGVYQLTQQVTGMEEALGISF